MTKTQRDLLDRRPWIRHIYDLRRTGGGILVELHPEWHFATGSGILKCDSFRDVRDETRKKDIHPRSKS